MSNTANIEQLILSSNFSLAELNAIIDAVKVARDRLGRLNMGNFEVGNKVSWTEKNGKVSFGVIEKINQKKIIVIQDNGAGWRIPASMLTLV
jgi:uncharacterized protein YijF (DUF1287 family)